MRIEIQHSEIFTAKTVAFKSSNEQKVNYGKSVNYVTDKNVVVLITTFFIPLLFEPFISTL